MFRLKKIFLYLLNKIPSRRLFRFYFSKQHTNNIGMVVALHRITAAGTHTDQSALNSFIEMTGSRLEETIINLQKLNVKFIALSELPACLQNDPTEKKPFVHFSFDDGYLDNATLAYPILKKYHIPFSIFVTSSFIDNRRPFTWWYIIEAIIKNERELSFIKYDYSISQRDYQAKEKSKIFEDMVLFILANIDNDRSYFEQALTEQAQNLPEEAIPKMMCWADLNNMVSTGLCELGIHTNSHARFRDITMEEKRKEILLCKEAIRANTGISSKYFAYPYGAKEDIGSREGLKEMLKDCGIEMAFTTIPGELNKAADKFFIPRILINNNATMYTLKSRLNGTYQRGINGG